jgi:hypothetical protein
MIQNLLILTFPDKIVPLIEQKLIISRNVQRACLFETHGLGTGPQLSVGAGHDCGGKKGLNCFRSLTPLTTVVYEIEVVSMSVPCTKTSATRVVGLPAWGSLESRIFLNLIRWLSVSKK